jgi:hypothetical protein
LKYFAVLGKKYSQNHNIGPRNETSIVNLELIRGDEKVQHVVYGQDYTLRAHISQPDGDLHFINLFFKLTFKKLPYIKPPYTLRGYDLTTHELKCLQRPRRRFCFQFFENSFFSDPFIKKNIYQRNNCPGLTTAYGLWYRLHE